MKVKFLGKTQEGISSYSPKLLDSVNRNNTASMDSFFGCDYWTAYEFSYLNASNQPVLQMLEIKIPMSSRQTVESKSLKLYLASFYKRKFTHVQSAFNIIERDLSTLLDARFTQIQTPSTFKNLINYWNLIESRVIFMKLVLRVFSWVFTESKIYQISLYLVAS